MDSKNEPVSPKRPVVASAFDQRELVCIYIYIYIYTSVDPAIDIAASYVGAMERGPGCKVGPTGKFGQGISSKKIVKEFRPTTSNNCGQKWIESGPADRK